MDATPPPSAPQSTSPYHSASSSSLVHHKRKFAGGSSTAAPAPAPFSLSDFGALTSNDDLDSLNAREEEDDSEEEADEEEEEAEGVNDSMRVFTAAHLENAPAPSGLADEEEEETEEDHDSMRVFTAARLENAPAPSGLGSTRSTKPPKTENPTVTVEPAEAVLASLGSKDGRGTVGQLAHQIISAVNSIVKEEVKGIFTENIQVSGAYIAREKGLKREVRYFAGRCFEA